VVRVTGERCLKADWPASCDAAGVGGNGKLLTGFLGLLGGRTYEEASDCLAEAARLYRFRLTGSDEGQVRRC
jgi:hypothetical protein